MVKGLWFGLSVGLRLWVRVKVGWDKVYVILGVRIMVMVRVGLRLMHTV